MIVQLVANNIILDLYDNVGFSLNYAIADIAEPDKRDAAYSKTIVLPGTATNNKFFTEIFEADLYGTFNPNLKATGLITVDTMTVINGYMQLTNVNIDDHKKIEYEVTIYASLATFYNNMGEFYLENLDLSAYDHVYNQATQIASWTNTPGVGYLYPMIDYGFNDCINWNVVHFFPAVYLKQYIDSIMSAAGFSYTSTFFNSAFFKQLIVPFNSDKFILSDSDITYRKFKATNNADADTTLTAGTNYITVPYNDNSSGNNNDPSGSFNISTYIFKAPFTGKYTFFADLDIQKVYHPNSPAYEGANLEFVWLEIMKKDTNGVYTSLNSSWMNNKSALYTSGSISNNNLSAIWNFYVATTNILNAGDQIYVRVTYNKQLTYPLFTSKAGGQGGWNTIIGGTVALRMKSNSNGWFMNDVVNDGLIEGETAKMNDAIPLKVKQKDFFTSIIKTFNLYVQPDPNNPLNLIIETRDTFYSQGVTKDWSSKLDISQQIQVKPMGYLDARIYEFAYKKDSDYYNDQYALEYDSLKNIYGDRRIIVNNDFLVNTNRTELLFSPTPSVGSIYYDRVLPTILSIDNSGNKTPKTSHPRLLYYKGVNPTNQNWQYIATSGTTSQSTFPYCGHLDDPFNPTLDLNFGIPNKLYYVATSGVINYTNNNLYNNYYSKMINEITDPNSKMVVAWMYLTQLDMYILDFRNKFFFNNSYYRLNKIMDYDPTTIKPIQCEFIKINEAQIFSAVVKATLGGAGTQIGAVLGTKGINTEVLPVIKGKGT